jgi:NADPH-dependent 2,4-dienoyl-CoA reductase/sulfur reductase-like enzyme
MAASPVPLAEPYDWVPHQLDHSEIEAILDTYVMAAGQFLAAGADGIEIHCAHETLPQSFLSPALNHRTDRWGGDAGGRTRFVTELLGRLRERIGADMALGIRICGQEFREGGYDLMEMREMITLIAATDTLDFVNVDVGHSWGSPSYVQPSYYDHAQYREVGRAIRADVAPIPTLFSGRVNDPVVAEELLAKGVCDLVGMTRAGIADPEFANKAREGRLIEIRRCIGCNRCIADSIESHAPEMFRKPTCSVNPVVGREIEWRYVRPASPSKRVVVVGGGAAGLELARVAAGRGHELIVLERAAALGGQLRIAARAPGRDAFEDFIYYEEHQMELLDVDLRLGVEADLDSVLALEPDVVACATGSVPRVPRTPGVDADHVVQGWDVLAGTAEVRGRVAVVSQEDHFETPNVVDFLASAGAEVEVFHKWTGIGSQIDRYSIGPILGRIHTHDVPVHTGWRLGEVAGRDLRFTSAFTGKGRTFPGFDSVVLVYGSVPDTSLYDQLGGRVPQRHLVGSAWVPRRLAEATQHGARLGTEL